MDVTPCRLCGAGENERFFELAAVPTSSCVLLGSRPEAEEWPSRRLALSVCGMCGFIQNDAFDPSAVDYTLPYEESQASSPVFRAFAETTVDRLIASYGLFGGSVLEVGCGKGEWLGLVCERGDMRGLGFDPAFVPGRIPPDQARRLDVVRSFFDEAAVATGDLIACRHTLEHVPDVDRFMGLLAAAAGRTMGSVVFVEVPDTGRVLREGAFWDVYYEHCSYFTAPSLGRLLRRHGLAVFDLRLDFGDQYLLAEAGFAEADSAPDGEVEPIVEAARRFGRLADERIAGWVDRLGREVDRGDEVVLWGAGSKAVGFLSAVDIPVAGVVDINPAKQGSFLPGSGVEVLAPGRLADLRPAVVVVMNPVYRSEIAAMLASAGLDPLLLTL